jgi:hypothetical protein
MKERDPKKKQKTKKTKHTSQTFHEPFSQCGLHQLLEHQIGLLQQPFSEENTLSLSKYNQF